VALTAFSSDFLELIYINFRLSAFFVYIDNKLFLKSINDLLVNASV